MPQTIQRPDLFNLHDGWVQKTTISGDRIDLELEFGIIARDHPANPTGQARYVKPCAVRFTNVTGQDLKMQDQATGSLVAHPEPLQPFPQVLIYEANPTNNGYRIRLTGLHLLGWVEWSFECASVVVSWSQIAGQAWYEK